MIVPSLAILTVLPGGESESATEFGPAAGCRGQSVPVTQSDRDS